MNDLPLSKTIIRYALIILVISLPLSLTIFSNSDPVALKPVNENAKQAYETIAQSTNNLGESITSETTKVASIITGTGETPQIAVIGDNTITHSTQNCGDRVDGSYWCKFNTLYSCSSGSIKSEECEYGCDLGKCLEKQELNPYKRFKLLVSEIAERLSIYVPD